MSTWRDLLTFSVPAGQKILLGCALARGISTQAETMMLSMILLSMLMILLSILDVIRHLLSRFDYWCRLRTYICLLYLHMYDFGHAYGDTMLIFSP